MRLNDDAPPTGVEGLTKAEMQDITQAIHDLETILLWFRRNEIKLRVTLGEDTMVLEGHNFEGKRLFKVKGLILDKGEA